MDKNEIEQNTIQFLQELVRAPGIAGELSAVSGVAARWMQSLGYDQVWQDKAGNVIGLRHGSKPGPKLVFDAHMDTVEVGELGAWVHAPFGGELSAWKNLGARCCG